MRVAMYKILYFKLMNFVNKRSLMTLFITALLFRYLLLLTVLESGSDGDFYTYSMIAHNILRGCGVAVSGPVAGTCVPHFGGNGLPGYPAFIALVWMLFGLSKPAVLWCQATIAALAVPRLAYAVGQLTASRTAALAVGAVVAFSPWEVLWVRAALSETLSIGAAMWLMAELVLSVHQRRLRVGWIATAFTAGLFLRLDFAVYLIPIALTATYVHGIRLGFRRGAVLACLIATPLAAWTARNVAVGLPGLLPPASGWMLPDGSKGPLGYLAWVASWATTEGQRADATFFGIDRYERIRLHPAAYRNPEQKEQVSVLLDELRAASGQPFPTRIDMAFAELAKESLADMGVAGRLRLRLSQSWALWAYWASPLPAEYLPLKGEDTTTRLIDAITKITQSPTNLMQTWMWSYRFALGLSFLTLAIMVLTTRQSYDEMFFVCAALAIVLAKTILTLHGFFLETRYTVTATPALELATCLAAFGLWKKFAQRIKAAESNLTSARK